jgi:hypothetical protein
MDFREFSGKMKEIIVRGAESESLSGDVGDGG